MSDTPRQVEGLDITEVEDGLVIFEPTSRRVHHLNVTATLVFELCTGDNSVDQIADIVRTAFGVPDTDAAEITAVVGSLRTEKLVI